MFIVGWQFEVYYKDNPLFWFIFEFFLNNVLTVCWLCLQVFNLSLKFILNSIAQWRRGDDRVKVWGLELKFLWFLPSFLDVSAVSSLSFLLTYNASSLSWYLFKISLRANLLVRNLVIKWQQMFFSWWECMRELKGNLERDLEIKRRMLWIRNWRNLRKWKKDRRRSWIDLNVKKTENEFKINLKRALRIHERTCGHVCIWRILHKTGFIEVPYVLEFNEF